MSRAAIVDPFSTGAYLAREFARWDVESVAVTSESVVPAEVTARFQPADYIEYLDASRDADTAAGRLESLGTRWVVAGSEWGVELAERLAARLGGDGNPPDSTAVRRDKSRMAQRLHDRGVAAPQGVVTDDPDELARWARGHFPRPVVVKPLRSAACDSIFFCSDPDEVAAAFWSIHGHADILGNRNDKVLAQELLEGPQYFVNSVSAHGRHFVHEVWEDVRTRQDGRVVYDQQRLLPSDSTRAELLRDYIMSVLDALDVRHGPAHSEVMLTGRGPVLIEVGARLEGSVTPEGPLRATGTSQVKLTVEALLNPARTAQRADARHYTLQRRLRVVCLIAPTKGRVAADALEALRALPTYFCGSSDLLAPGTAVEKTVDLVTSPGHLYLLADDEDALDRDHARIRALERQGLYDGGPA